MIFFPRLLECLLLAGTLQTVHGFCSNLSSYPMTVIDEFPTPKTLENIAARSNGELLVTSTESPFLRQVSPLDQNSHVQIARIPYAKGLLGIAELEKDVFYVVSSNITSRKGAPGSNLIWRVDLRHVGSNSTPLQLAKAGAPQVTLVANLTTATTLNGLCGLGPNNTSTLLVTDSGKGNIIKVDVQSGNYTTLIDNPLLSSTASGLQVAANGVHVRGSDLFFTNLNRGIFARFPLSLQSVTPAGPIDIIVDQIPSDDFVVAPNGRIAWLTINGHGSIVEVNIPEKTSRIILESSYLESVSAVTLGRTLADRNSLFVTSGGTLNPTIMGNGTVGGITARVDVPCNVAW